MMKTVLIIGFMLNAVEDREDLGRLLQQLECEAAGCSAFCMAPSFGFDDCVVLTKEVPHEDVTASHIIPPRFRPRCHSYWIGSDRRWG